MNEVTVTWVGIFWPVMVLVASLVLAFTWLKKATR